MSDKFFTNSTMTASLLSAMAATYKLPVPPPEKRRTDYDEEAPESESNPELISSNSLGNNAVENQINSEHLEDDDDDDDDDDEDEEGGEECTVKDDVNMHDVDFTVDFHTMNLYASPTTTASTTSQVRPSSVPPVPIAGSCIPGVGSQLDPHQTTEREKQEPVTTTSTPLNTSANVTGFGPMSANPIPQDIVSQKSKPRKRSESGEIVACANCKAINTPLWRKGMNNDTLCNRCGLYWKRNGYYRPIVFDRTRRSNSERKKAQKVRDQLSKEPVVHSPRYSSSVNPSFLNQATASFGMQQTVPATPFTQPAGGGVHYLGTNESSPVSATPVSAPTARPFTMEQLLLHLEKQRQLAAYQQAQNQFSHARLQDSISKDENCKKLLNMVFAQRKIIQELQNTLTSIETENKNQVLQNHVQLMQAQQQSQQPQQAQTPPAQTVENTESEQNAANLDLFFDEQDLFNNEMFDFSSISPSTETPQTNTAPVQQSQATTPRGEHTGNNSKITQPANTQNIINSPPTQVLNYIDNNSFTNFLIQKQRQQQNLLFQYAVQQQQKQTTDINQVIMNMYRQ